MSPGMSHGPVTEMILALGGTPVESAGPICTMRSPVIRTVAFLIAGPPSTATTVPPTNAVITGGEGTAAAAITPPSAAAQTAPIIKSLLGLIGDSGSVRPALCRKILFLVQFGFHDASVPAVPIAVERRDISLRSA